MENRVGEIVPSEKELTQTVSQLNAVEEKVARYGVTLTPEQRRATPKPRVEWQPVVELVAELASEYGVKSPEVNVDEMLADLELAEAIRPVDAAAQRVAQATSDTILQAEGECWHAATAFYTMLSSMAAHDPKLAQKLQPVTSFFALGRRKRPATPPPAK
jgi:hypothetical protein